MKLVSTLIILSVAAIATLAFLGKQFGIDIIKIDIPSLPSIGSVDDVKSNLTGTTRVQKWQDENGQWHFGSEAPAGSVSQELLIDINQNVVQAYQAKQAEPEEGSSADENTGNTGKVESIEDTMDMSPTLPSQMLMQLQQQAAEKALANQ